MIDEDAFLEQLTDEVSQYYFHVPADELNVKDYNFVRQKARDLLDERIREERLARI